MFPFSIGGKINVTDTTSLSPLTIEDEIASTLLVSGVTVDYLPDGGILFRLGLVEHFGWTFLLGASSGTVRCVRDPAALQISYHLRFHNLSILVSVLLVILKGLEVAVSPLCISVEYYLMVWIWLVSGNILVTLHEFRRFLRRSAVESAERIFYWRT